MATTKDIKKLEKNALIKYEDLLDTLLVLEAMKAQAKPGKEWKEQKEKLMKNV
ncbi:hypothetical protein [Candidatus Kuenenia sp.]|uniref:hypothetical protein n=1 Tax=Candidatus Kuenenia sp. TaxID=2499824 RepID=UPI00321FC939